MNILRWLDPRAHPIVCSAAGSLLAAAVVALFAWTLRFPALTTPVPAWTLAVSICLLAGCAIGAYSLRSERLFITLSAFDRKHWFADLLQHMLLDFALHGIDVIVKVPDTDYSPHDQSLVFKGLLRRRLSYRGGILVPIEPHSTRGEILAFVKNFDKPLLFVDVMPFDNEELFPKKTAFVGYDSWAGGACAAEAMAKELDYLNVSASRVLVIGSNVQTDRQAGFESRIRDLLPAVQVTRHDEARFSRTEARRIVEHYLRQFSHSLPFEAVFCTNDEMALGACEALAHLPNRQREKVVVVGYDGTEEAILAIERHTGPLRNTVVQDTSRLSETAVKTIELMVTGALPEPRINRLRPRPYKDVQVEHARASHPVTSPENA